MYNTTDKILLRILAGKALEFKQSKWLLIIITTECTLGVFLVLDFVRRFREYIELKRRKFYE